VNRRAARLGGMQPGNLRILKDCANPKRTEIVHTSHAGEPTVADMPPIENRTKAGTPAAINTTCFQSTSRNMVAGARVMGVATLDSTVAFIQLPHFGQNLCSERQLRVCKQDN
jgi:hypothetical protein